MAKEPIPTWCFALVIVRRSDEFLMVQERKHDQTWFLPGGRLDPGETFAEAAIRETQEEAGVPIAITGVVRVQHTPRDHNARMRVVFTGEPIGNDPLKAVADRHSLGAKWVRID